MSKLARALILAVVVAVLPLAGMTAVAHAQANDQDTPSQQELADPACGPRDDQAASSRNQQIAGAFGGATALYGVSGLDVMAP